MRATSRWLVKRILPALVKRRRRRRSSSGSTADHADRYPVPAAEVLAGALAATRRGDRRRHDVLQAEPGAGAAVVAGGPAAVLDGHPGQRVLPVAPEEVTVQPGGDVVPGERLAARPLPVAHLLGAQALGRQGRLPQRQGEALRPLLEGAAGAPDPLDHGAHAPVTPARQSLRDGGGRVVPADS